jgi:glycine/D-amino acid oxidase-like deaminating enzyme
LDRPGWIEYGAYNNHLLQQKYLLRRILVDEDCLTHVLQRSNGDTVAGGGARLEFGGSSTVLSAETLPKDQQSGNNTDQPLPTPSLLELAVKLAPAAMKDVESVRICHAVRPMPKDGLPVAGFQQNDRLYIVVTHSGITLGPLLAELAAVEITESISLEILQPYRPTRFDGAMKK